MTQTGVIVIVPCYNEENRLQMESYLEFVRREEGYQFLFVDDGSKDRTLDVLRIFCEKEPERLKMMNLERNSGKAEAVRQGFLAALDSKPKFLAYWDADLSTPLYVLPDFVALFEKRPDLEMVCGSRVKLMGHNIQRLAIRHYLGRIFATCASFALRLSIYDTQCGAKMFRVTDALRLIFEKPFGSNWIFDVELIARFVTANRNGSARRVESLICELPLPAWFDVTGSKVRPVDFFNAFWELAWIYLRYHRDLTIPRYEREQNHSNGHQRVTA